MATKKKRSTQPTKKKIDRISSLPLNIIHDHILSSLPNEDIKVMSSLSKTWYQITKSFPYLVFHGSFSHTSDKFLSYVTQKLQSFRDNYLDINLRKLEIRIMFCPRVAPYLDSWIDLALQHNVEELNLQITSPTDDPTIRAWYDLPPSVFAAKSVKVVEISGCSLLKREFVGGSSGNLQQLTLDYVVLDEVAVSSIISSCPLLEELTFMQCTGNSNCLRISNLPKLKCLEITNLWVKELEIEAPSLENLVIDGSPKLKNMDLDFLSRLPSLRSLHLFRNPRLTKLKLSSCNLNTLEMCRFGNKNVLELEIDAPNLVSAIYYGEFAPLFASSVCPWNHVSTRYHASENPLIKFEDFLVELNNFFSKKKHVKYLNLFISNISCSPFNFNKLHERVVQLAKNIDNLELDFYCLRKKMHCTNVLDVVLWICQPRTLSLKIEHNDSANNNKYVAKHICKLIISHRDRCSCQARIRWLHHLQEVMYVKEDGTEDVLPMEGTSPPYFRSSYDTIKFIFKW